MRISNPVLSDRETLRTNLICRKYKSTQIANLTESTVPVRYRTVLLKEIELKTNKRTYVYSTTLVDDGDKREF